MSETQIFMVSDRDGDVTEFTNGPHDRNEGGVAVTVHRGSDDVCVAYLAGNEVDDLIDALAEYRGHEVPDGETDYELRLRAVRDAKPLLQGMFGPASPEKLIMVAEYLVQGLPAVKA